MLGWTPDERIGAVAGFGFTERQARFLAAVMLFGGVCVPKQYAQFAGTAYGHKVNTFFDKLVRHKFATKCRCSAASRVSAALRPRFAGRDAPWTRPPRGAA